MQRIFTPKAVQEYLEWRYPDTLAIDKDKSEGDRIVAGEEGVALLTLDLAETLYDTKIEAVDDPSDSDSASTGDPLKFITEFMSTGIGDEFISGMAFTKPSDVTCILRRVAMELSSGPRSPWFRKWHRTAFKRYMRRVVARLFTRRVAQSEFEKMGVKGLKENMEKKGWDVKAVGEYELKVNIGDVYEANIEMDSILWNYEIVAGDGEMSDSGSSDWPREQIEAFMKQDEVIETIRAAKKAAKKKKYEEEGYGATSRPGKAWKEEKGQTEPVQS